MTQIIAQFLPVLESLPGVKFDKLLEQVPALKKAIGREREIGARASLPAQNPSSIWRQRDVPICIARTTRLV